MTYYATYTAYNGVSILPQLIETKDFIKFKISTLNGNAVQNKGMALFPRKIQDRYVMLSRQDGENNRIMFSDNIHFWHESEIIQEPARPWELVYSARQLWFTIKLRTITVDNKTPNCFQSNIKFAVHSIRSSILKLCYQFLQNC